MPPANRSCVRLLWHVLRWTARLSVVIGVGASPAPAQTPVTEEAQLAAQSACVDTIQRFATGTAKDNKSRQYGLLREGLQKLSEALAKAQQSNTLLVCPPMVAGATTRTFATRATAAINDVGAQKFIDEEVQTFKTRVFGGWQVPPQALPEVVAIKSRAGEWCTGTLIGSKAILTAAHCFCSDGGNFDHRGDVMFGNRATEPRETIPISWAVSMRPDFCRVQKSQFPAGEDLALAILASDATVARPTQLVNFTGQYLGQPSQNLIVVGFGLTEKYTSGQKLYASVPIKSPLCDGVAESLHGCARGREVVLADKLGRVDTCGGDSGGPVYYRDMGQAPAPERWVLAAVTSRASADALRVNSQVKCGPGGIYTLLGPAAMSWLCRWHAAAGFSVAGITEPCAAVVRP
jgi:Trypsin